MAKTTTDVTVVESEEPRGLVTLAENWNEIAEIFRDNVGDTEISPFNLPRVKLAAGGISVFQKTTIDGDETPNTITGVVAHWATWRGYWPEKFSGGGSPPECRSDDGRVGVGSPGGICRNCSLNKFGTAIDERGKPGAGKACKEMKALFLIDNEAPSIPTLILLPPTSGKKWSDFCIGLASRGLQYWKSEVELSLVKAQNSTGIPYSEVVIRRLSNLSPAGIETVKAYREMIAPLTQRVIESDIMNDAYEAADIDELAS